MLLKLFAYPLFFYSSRFCVSSFFFHLFSYDIVNNAFGDFSFVYILYRSGTTTRYEA